MKMQTETLDDDFGPPSNPGTVRLSENKLNRLQPELSSTLRWIQFLFRNPTFISPRKLWKKHIAEHLMWGDSRAAVVIQTQPLLIAAFTDEIDCIALLRFDDTLADEYNLYVGKRLITINTYSDLQESPEKDLVPGPHATGLFGNVHAFVAEFLTDDVDRLEDRKAEIDEDEWTRTEELGRAYVSRTGAMARDGRPILSAVPATLPIIEDQSFV